MDSVGNLSSPRCSGTNVMALFTPQVRRFRSHGRRHYNKSSGYTVKFEDLMVTLQKPLGIHHVRTTLYSLPLSVLRCLQVNSANTATTAPGDLWTLAWRLHKIIDDVAQIRLFKPVRTDSRNTPTVRQFMKVEFANKGVDAINISNILHQKSVQANIPPYFVYKTTPVISYSYTKPIASKLFNYKQTLQQLNVDDLRTTPPAPCSCSASPYNYGPAGHIVTGDLDIIQNGKLRELFMKGPKYREAPSINWNVNFKILMDSVEKFAREWAKREHAALDSLSEWIKSIRSIILKRIRSLKVKMKSKNKSIFLDPEVKSTLESLHEKYVIVPADKASNNLILVCRHYYISCIQKELGLLDTKGNPTYTLSNLPKDDILANHASVLQSFRLPINDKDTDLPCLYWIPKLHKNPYKQRFISGSSNCSTKPLSKLLTTILATIKSGLQSYCDTVYSRSGINGMWILKNSKELLSNLEHPLLKNISSIRTFDFSTLYTTIPHSKLKERLRSLVMRAFFSKKGERRYKYMVVNYTGSYFVKNTSNSKK